MPHKRLIVLCDGTWQNSFVFISALQIAPSLQTYRDVGYDKPSIFKKGGLQIPSNVTRMSRSLKHTCRDGMIQIMNYQSGVGSSGSFFDVLTGGAFGVGISEHIREAYAFICANVSYSTIYVH
jgi:hypothetical protein